MSFRGRDHAATPAGLYDDAYRVDVTVGGKRDSYWFDPAPPHVLIRMERADGAVYSLRKTLRIAYWEHHDPGDEKLLE